MKTYIANFSSEAGYAICEFEAQSAEDALRMARSFAEERADELIFTPYDYDQPIDHIRISEVGGDEVAFWYDNDAHLRRAASDLLDAADLALRELREFCSGDESEAVRLLTAAIAKAKGSRT